MYVGSGTFQEFDGVPVKDEEGRGSIALMEFHSGDRWRNAALLGASAVLFLPDADATCTESLHKVAETPLQFPRFYVDDPGLAQKLMAASREEREVELKGKMSWKSIPCENLLALLPANEPAEVPETFLVTLHYDAMSIVPGAAQGGQSADNLASTLCALKLLGSESLHLKRRHHLLVLFDGARGRCNEGTRRFGAVLRDVQLRRLAEAERQGIEEGSREVFLSGKLSGMKPWMLEREALYRLKEDRLQAALDWLSAVKRDGVKGAGRFEHEDRSPQAPSPNLPHADPREWLEEWVRDTIKAKQISVLISASRDEQEEGVTPFTPDEEVSPVLRRLRQRRAYYKRIFAENELEGMVEALKNSPQSLCLGEEDATLDALQSELDILLRELKKRRHILRASMALAEQLKDYDVTRSVAVDLSSGNSVLTVHRSRFIGGDRVYASPSAMEWAWTLGPMISQSLERVVDGANECLTGNGKAFEFADSVTFDASREKQTQAPENYEFTLDLAQAGVSGCTLVTGNDPRSTRLGPGDRMAADSVSLKNLGIQSRTLALLLAHALIRPELFAHAEKNSPMVMRVTGRTVIQDPRAGPFPKLPMPGCVVVMKGDPQVKGSVWMDRFALSDLEGDFSFDEIPCGNTYDGPYPLAQVSLEAFKLSDKTGMLSVAPDAALSGRGATQTTVDLWGEDLFRRLVVFEGAAIQAYGANDPMLFSPLQEARLLEGKGGELEKWFVFHPRRPSPTLVALVPEDALVKTLLSLPGYGYRMFLLGDQKEGGPGIGRRVGEGLTLQMTVPKAARQLWRLNDERIAKLESKGVRSQVASRLHGESTQQLEEMEQFLQENAYSKGITLARSVWGKELRAYPELFGLSNEAVLAAVILLAFLAPWAHFHERLILQCGGIRGRIVGFVSFFAAGFALLYGLHPAFQISEAPVVILIAYALAGLAILSLGMIMKRYARVMRQWREKTGGVHSSDISRASAFSVAFSLGLTNMAKRPLQTGLIILVIALLSFSVMTFTSVETQLDTRMVPVSDAGASKKDGLLFRLYNWATIPPSMAESFQQDLGPDCLMARRMWYVRTELPWDIGLGLNKFVFTRPDTGRSVTVECLQGFMPEEKEITDLADCVKGTWFSGTKDEIILPTQAAEALDVKAEDLTGQDDGPVLVQYGERLLRVIGILDSARADRVLDLSGTPLSHVDFYASGFAPHWDLNGPVGEEVDVEFMGFDRTVLLSCGLLEDLGGGIKTSVALFAPQIDAQTRVKELMKRFSINVYASLGGRAYLVKTASSQSVRGAWKMVLPLLLVVLIMVNLMMSTVEERQEEIRMLGAVGLAPKHVSILYLSESCVYGVLGLVYGVMLGLVVSWVTKGVDVGVSVNYASIPTVSMGLGVLLVVVVATVLPASRAARLATPSGASEWELPETAGDEVCIQLPFTMTKRNGVAVLVFLHEYLRGHTEPTSPEFRCDDVRVGVKDSQEEETLSIEGRVWLAPYDIGVCQDLTLSLRQEGELFAVSFRAKRRSGALQPWHRAHFRFADTLRQQFLIFRTLSEARKREYFETAHALFMGRQGGSID